MKARWDQREGNRDSKEVQIRTRLTGHIFSCSWQDNHHISIRQQLQTFSFVHAMRYHRLTSATHFFHSYYLRNFDPLIPGVGELDVLSPHCVKSHSHTCCQIRDMNSSQKTVAQKQGRKSIEGFRSSQEEACSICQPAYMANSLLFSGSMSFPGATFPSGIKIDG